jgi:hypothetical protein
MKTNTSQKDSTLVGILTGLLLPLIGMFIFFLFMNPRFGSFEASLRHFQNFGILYKIVSLSLMPGAGLFFWWSHINKINQARGVLLMSLFYGVWVIVLYSM